MRSTTVFSIFFSLRGTLPRDQWRLAMLASLSVFTSVISVLSSRDKTFAQQDAAGPSWLLLSLCLGYVAIVSLLCAKRLLNCRRPIWLALAIAPAGVLLSLTFATGTETLPDVLNLLTVYLALFAMPVFITCALYDADD